jgi:hypothetical protein
MKYSLRSLMIVVTLACVLLGGVMGRIEYLRRKAAHHEREWQEIARSGKWVTDMEYYDSETRHAVLMLRFRKAVYRPWTFD